MHLLSMFCGPGGLDLGFKKAGFSTRVAFDIDRDCVATFNHNHGAGNPVAHKWDIRHLKVADILGLAGDGFMPVGLVGGPPCQSFSVSNVHQADDDPRHDLPFQYARIVKEVNAIRPTSFFLFENVPGLLGPRHVHRYTKFKSILAKAGFDIHERTLDAMNFGVPQQRERIFVVGINRLLHPAAEWCWPNEMGTRKTVRETIEGLPDPKFNERGLKPADIPFHPNHWSMMPRSKKFTTAGMLVEGQSWGRSFRTLAWDEPSWTVAYGNREVHVHPSGRRRLSVYEAMLLQSFPHEYQLVGNISAQIRLVSEAVAPEMAFLLASAIRTCLKL